MRKNLVDSAQRKRRTKHGGGRHRVEVDDEVPEPPSSLGALPALDEALTRLAAEDTEAAGIVVFRSSTGLSVEEAARRTGIVALMMHAFATTTAEQALKSRKSPAVTEVQKLRSGDWADRRWQFALICDIFVSSAIRRSNAARRSAASAGVRYSRLRGKPSRWRTSRLGYCSVKFMTTSRFCPPSHGAACRLSWALQLHPLTTD
jgi:hypothetical protein